MSGDPWLDVFRGDADRAVTDLFSGRAGVGSNLRLDIPEFLYQTFPPSLADERERLDVALSSWLVNMREDYPGQVARLGFSVYGKRLGDALIALQLLDLPETRRRIRADVDTWLRWLAPLRLAPERDPALECRRLLTREQPDARHTAMWLRLASDRRPEYLTVALVGLQSLPNQDDARTKQRLMLQALLRHAVSARHEVAAARRLFSRRFAALRGLFPRSPAHWDRLLLEALDGFVESTRERMGTELAKVLRESMASGPQHPSQKGATAVHQPAPMEAVNRLKSDIQGTDHQSETLARRLFDLLERNHGYAEATGVSYFLVRTLNNLGHRLLKRHRLGETEMARLGLMIERALAWEPMDSYCWMLWADWFRAQGRSDAREWTLREMLRLFPDNEASRVELARLLTDRGEDHWEEAEHWLRQAVERNPDGEHSRVELARLLMRRGGGEHLEEAERLLRQVVDRTLDHEHSRVELARLLMRRGGDEHLEEAERLLREVMDRNSKSEHSRVELARLLMRQGGGEHLEEAERLLREAMDRNSKSEHSRVELARLLMHRGGDKHLEEAERLLREAMERNPGGEHPRAAMADLLIQRGHEADAERLLAEQSHDQSRNGMDSAGDGDLLAGGADTEDHGHPTSLPPAAPDELAGRDHHATADARTLLAKPPAHQPADPNSLPPLDEMGVGVNSADEGAHLDNLGDTEGHGHLIPPPTTALDELARRGLLAGELSRARIAGARRRTASTVRIRQEARRGDPLAGFYSQWLIPQETPECPPHAWAWNACRGWQGSAQPELWRDLAAEFPEAAGETDFLRILAAPEAADEEDGDRSGAARWRVRYGPDGDTEPSPSVAFMCKALERIGETTSAEREELAFTVMAGKAVEVPEFAPAYAA